MLIISYCWFSFCNSNIADNLIFIWSRIISIINRICPFAIRCDQIYIINRQVKALKRKFQVRLQIVIFYNGSGYYITTKRMSFNSAHNTTPDTTRQSTDCSTL